MWSYSFGPDFHSKEMSNEKGGKSPLIDHHFSRHKNQQQHNKKNIYPHQLFLVPFMHKIVILRYQHPSYFFFQFRSLTSAETKYGTQKGSSQEDLEKEEVRLQELSALYTAMNDWSIVLVLCCVHECER